MKHVVVVGGGFGGVKAALELSRKRLRNLKITLISNSPHFEYHGALYRVLAGHSPMEVCVPLNEIFEGTGVEVVQDSVVSIDLQKKEVRATTTYRYDFLVLAVGSENSYFNTPGLKELSFSINSIENTFQLNHHLHDIFMKCKVDDSDDKNCSAHIVIVGAGATGCEVAGELAVYAREIAKKHGIDPSFVTIDLIQSGNRLMPMLSADVSETIKKRLYSLGVNIFLNRRVLKEEIEQVYLKDMEMKTKTLIWCAGVKPSSLVSQTAGLTFDKRGRVEVTEYLQAKGYEDVYVLGDIAATQYSGMAQTALVDGIYAAGHIASRVTGQVIGKYVPVPPKYALPLGPDWAVASIGPFHLSGYPGWILRRYMDLKVFRSVLPLSKAIVAFQSDRILCEYCPMCCKLTEKKT